MIVYVVKSGMSDCYMSLGKNVDYDPAAFFSCKVAFTWVDSLGDAARFTSKYQARTLARLVRGRVFRVGKTP